ncbi:hypothetical protein Pmani_027603 [Petrolisthes manimaculis]|uniref:Uncharacterized protein n=1 Tax=Petrolisthes manimaculis TaxID=1843537 RepID=A0AAE1P3Y8_9EUCA|nr:hypothetical protein Pmani_027603 [Petrolisthes manimaculis]
MTCGERGEYGNGDDMWTERHQTSPPAVPLDSDKMQCANIFFILSIGFASAALAISQIAEQFVTKMKIISPGMPFEVSTSEGIISNKFELEEGEAASVRCPHIYLPRPRYQRLVISDGQTYDELYSSDSDIFMAEEEYIFEEDFSIELIESEPYMLLDHERAARPQVECIIERSPASQ